MSHGKWRGSKQHQSISRSCHQIRYFLVSLHFPLCFLTTHPVELHYVDKLLTTLSPKFSSRNRALLGHVKDINYGNGVFVFLLLISDRDKRSLRTEERRIYAENRFKHCWNSKGKTKKEEFILNFQENSPLLCKL